MTLVVSDISIHGVVMVGDSAATRIDGSTTSVVSDAVKVHYSPEANIGFSIWGDANVGANRMDCWLDDFIRRNVRQGDSIKEIGENLAASLNGELMQTRRSWKELRRGIHISGYRDGLPVLFHVHTGHAGEPDHELRLYKDFPDNKNWSEDQYREVLLHDFPHLRNGYYELFGRLFDKALNYAGEIRSLDITFPAKSLKGRLEFYKVLVRFVAGTLVAAEKHPRVNDKLCCVAFDSNGLVVDERLPLANRNLNLKSHYDEFF